MGDGMVAPHDCNMGKGARMLLVHWSHRQESGSSSCPPSLQSPGVAQEHRGPSGSGSKKGAPNAIQKHNLLIGCWCPFLEILT